MNTFSQWVHQHNFLLVCIALLGGLGLLPAFRLRSIRLWLAWLGILGLFLIVVITLRTPAASVSEYPNPLVSSDPTAPGAAYSEPELSTVEDIEEMISRGRKPTLVEVYADYGFS